MHLSTMNEWLAWIGSVHQTEIELGLDRVKKVAAKLNLLTPSCPVIIVGGTNGKGSTVAGLEAIYQAAGYQVGAFTSPIVFKHNEEVRINGQCASDEAFCHAFAEIEAARGQVSLTPFEFHTLAALFIFARYPLDVLLLEVGLGGRLDAVNIIDADVSIVTSISLDHVEWLGKTCEAIAREKAGIFRQGKFAISGDLHPPASLSEEAMRIGAPLVCQGKDFCYNEAETTWSWSYRDIHYPKLPLTSLAMQNMSTVLMAITLLQQRLPVREAALIKGFSTVKLFGRIQVVEGDITHIYDVSHNPASVSLLAKRLQNASCSGRTRAVFSMLADKDIKESLRMISEQIDDWYIAPLRDKRAASKEVLAEAFLAVEIQEATFFQTLSEAYDAACIEAQKEDRLIIFGSFRTVAEVWDQT